MRALNRFGRGLVALFHRRHVEQELDDELQAFLDAAVDRHLASGMTREAAVRAARLEIGSVESVKDYTRDAGWESGVESLWQDVRYAVRGFGRSPGFTAAAVTTLALGIGGTTAIFSVVDRLFLRAPDGVSDAVSLRRLYIKRDTGTARTGTGGPGSWNDYLAMRGRVPGFSGVAAFLPPAPANVGRGSGAEQVQASTVSHDFLNVLGVRPALGRFFLQDEDGAAGAHPVVVISHRFWQGRFGGAREALGTTMRVNGIPVEIVGITQRGFTGIGAQAVDLWLPSSTPAEDGRDWRPTMVFGLNYIARLAPGATDATANGEAARALATAAKATPSLDPTPEVVTTSLALAARPIGIEAAGTLSLWLALVSGLVLLVACANVANLLLARAISRRRELSVRLSLGAGAWRVARQHLTESTLLALCGGAAGVLLAYLGMGLMRQFPIPPSAGRVDARLLGFALAVSILTGLLFGLLPALRAVRLDPMLGLKDARGDDHRRPNRSATTQARRALVALQVMLSITLLVGAGLLVRSLQRVTGIDAGLAVDRLLVARVDLRGAGYPAGTLEQFYDDAVSRVLALPGIERAAFVHAEPFGEFYPGTVFWRIPGRPAPNNQPVWSATLNVVGPGYFSTVGTRLLRGREIMETDRAGEPVAVVDEKAARLMADDGNVVGLCVPFNRQLKLGGCTRIVGVVETPRRWYLDEKLEPTVFVARAHFPAAIPFGVPSVLIRTRGEPAGDAAAVQSALQGLRADLPYVRVYPLADNIADDILPYRLGATLFSLFGVLALAVSGVGLYGVLGYFVSERTAEMGLRRSLGATGRAIAALVVRQGLVPVMSGLVIGLAAAFGGTRYLGWLLFGVEPLDPIAFGAATAFLLCVALIAMLVPAWRAARVDPLVALRAE